MPIGLVSDADFQLELSRSGRLSPQTSDHTHSADVVPSDVISGTVIESNHRGRSGGDNNVPDSLRKIIGEAGVIDGRQAALDIAKDFGISPSSVSAYTKGSTSTTSYNQPTQSIVVHLNKSRERASKRAGKVLNQSLKSITQEKLDYADPKDLAGIAKDMSVIIRNLEPQQVPSESSAAKQPPQFTIYAPQFRDERSFEIIHVSE